MSGGGAVFAILLLCVGFGVGVWYYRDRPEALAAFVTAFYQAFNEQDRSRSSPAKENDNELPNEVTVSPEDDDSTVRTVAGLYCEETDGHRGDSAMDCTETEAAEHVTCHDGLYEEALPV
jgi:hypothetical protein